MDPYGEAALSTHVVVVGSGSLARSVCFSLAAVPAPDLSLRVTVLARNLDAADELTRASRIRAAVAGTGTAFTADRLAAADELIGRLRPAVLVCCASAQSPYERLTAPSAWTQLVERLGFGLTLPLQAEVVAGLSGTVARVSPDTLLVNGCFPDAVNPLLAALGRPVHCGIGNVATLAACLQSTLDLPDQRGLAVLGHHVHLTAPEQPAGEARAWRDGTPVGNMTELLAPGRSLPRPELNAIGGHAAARLLIDLIRGEPVSTNLPGPLGLPGGYPVIVAGRSISLRLPTGLTTTEAVAWNLDAARRDGVEVAGDRVSYPIQVAAELANLVPQLAGGWTATELEEIARHLTALRRRLRLATPVPAG